MKRILFTTLLVSLPSMISANSLSSSSQSDNSGAQPTSQVKINYQTALIKSQVDQHKLYEINSPFLKLPAEAQSRFIESLEFGDSGLSSFYYKDLEEYLSVKEAYVLLKLLGAQNTVHLLKKLNKHTDEDKNILSYLSKAGSPGGGTGEADHKDYKCESRGTCVKDSGYICTSNC